MSQNGRILVVDDSSVQRTLLTQGVCQARAGQWLQAEGTLTRANELDPAAAIESEEVYAASVPVTTVPAPRMVKARSTHSRTRPAGSADDRGLPMVGLPSANAAARFPSTQVVMNLPNYGRFKTVEVSKRKSGFD